MRLSQLRPVFFRSTGKVIRSGWIDITNGDVWCRESEEGERVLIPGARPALLIGERVQFTTEVDIWPEGFVEPGDRGVVFKRDRISGAVQVILEGFQLGDNSLVLQPHNVDEMVLEGIKQHSDMFTTAPSFRLQDFVDETEDDEVT